MKQNVIFFALLGMSILGSLGVVYFAYTVFLQNNHFGFLSTNEPIINQPLSFQKQPKESPPTVEVVRNTLLLKAKHQPPTVSSTTKAVQSELPFEIKKLLAQAGSVTSVVKAVFDNSTTGYVVTYLISGVKTSDFFSGLVSLVVNDKWTVDEAKLANSFGYIDMHKQALGGWISLTNSNSMETTVTVTSFSVIR